MSLQVWLPLTKDLRQNGLANVTVTNNGATYSSTGGKLGGCYSFNGSSNYIRVSIPTGMTTILGCTVAAWVKSTSSTLALGGISQDVSNYSAPCVTLYSSGWQFTSTAKGGYSYVSGGTVANTSVWHHVACTVDTNGNIVTYLDGSKVTSSSLTTLNVNANTDINSSNFIEIGCDHPGGDEFLTGYVNDFRVYDNALSPLEVKQLSQGLALHYKLDNNSTYTSLIDKTAGYNVYNNFGSDVTYSLSATGEYYKDSPVRRLTATINNSSRISSFKTELWSHGVYNWSRTFSANTKYAFWIYYKPVTYTDVRVGGIASNISGWTEIPPEYVGDGWYRVGQYRDGSVTSDKTDSIFVSFTWASAVVNTPVSIDFACPVLVQGVSEIQESAEFEASSVVRDCSGFENNGEISGTWNSEKDTLRYKTSSHMSTTSSKIHITNFPTSGFGDSYSFAWWGKRSSNSPMFWGFSNGVRLNGMYAGTLWNTGDSSSNPIYNPGTTTTITAPSLNVWHHYVMTGDGTSCKLYLDGVLYGQAKTYKSISGSDIYINGWSSSTDYCSNDTYMSDFRIYATALSADDVKALYQNSGYVDNKGNVYGFLYEE